jgi:hypothetical protein
MRFPLSMTLGMAGYIARNKIRPKPEWQVNRAPATDPSNPFRIIHTIPHHPHDSEPRAQGAPDDCEALSTRVDAGAAAHL